MGVYVHIPFCRSKCFYCGFYSVASPRLQDEFVGALCREVELRKDYLPDTEQDTLYIGGGTPSYLEAAGLEKIIRKLESVYEFTDDAERTIEMNPEDITDERLEAIRRMGFNRLSIGVQSFDDHILKRINRVHSAETARQAVLLAAKAGFENIGIDLIIGLPGQEMKDIEHDLHVINDLSLSHISVYILSIDSNSVYQKLTEKGRFLPEEDDILASKYQYVSDALKRIGFEHYEISNFARENKYSRHNTAYWQQKPYIGLGPSAHSYDGFSRQWNIANLKNYIDNLNNNILSFEKEELSDIDKYNEYIMTNLRTVWGMDSRKLEKSYPEFWNRSRHNLQSYLENGYVFFSDHTLCLTEKGWLISDRIFSDLFYLE